MCKFIGWLLAVLGILLVVFALDIELGLAECKNSQENRTQCTESYDNCSPALNGPIFRQPRRWIGETLRDGEKEIVAGSALALVLVTGLLAIYTFGLWSSTGELVRGAEAVADRQSGEMQSSLRISDRAATAAKDSADTAFKTAMPVLFPFITGHALHPLARMPGTISYNAGLLVGFDNYGKTPAIVRQFKARLFLTESDGLPRNLTFDEWDATPYDVIVPGDSRAINMTSGALDFRQPVTMTSGELDELLAEASAPVYRRFALIGHVIYDDFFGNRHTRRFSIKTRVMPKVRATRRQDGITVRETIPGIFQLSVSAREYNSIAIEKIPDPDPLA